MRELEFIDQALDAICFFRGLRSSLWMFRPAPWRGLPSPARPARVPDLRKASDFCRAPAPLAGDDLVTVALERSHQDRLHQALFLDRGGELLERRIIHLGARLIAAALQLIDAQRSPGARDGRASESRSRSASSPLPNPFSFTAPPLQVRCARGSRDELDVGLRALAFTIEGHRRRTVARRFREPHVARNHRGVHLVAEVLLQLGRHLLCERVAGVIHGP